MKRPRLVWLVALGLVALLLAGAAMAPTPLDVVENEIERVVVKNGFTRTEYPHFDFGGFIRGEITASYARPGMTLEEFNVMCEELRRSSVFGFSTCTSSPRFYIDGAGESGILDTVTYYFPSESSWGTVSATIEYRELAEGPTDSAVMVVRDVRNYWALIRGKFGF